MPASRPTTRLALLLALAAAACARGSGDAKGAPASDDAASAAAEPAAAATGAPGAGATTGDEGAAVYTWYDAAGVPHLAASVEDVPEAARDRVVVSHLGASEATALADEVTVGDFTGDAPAFSKVDLGRLADGAGPAGRLDHDGVFVYSAPWCGFCKKAKAWLDAHEVPYVDRDIEGSPGAAAELKAKLKEAGLEFGGVPVLDVRGRIVVGFDPKAIEAALATHPAEKADPPPKQDG